MSRLLEREKTDGGLLAALLPKAEAGAAFIVFAPCPTDAVLFGIFR